MQYVPGPLVAMIAIGTLVGAQSQVIRNTTPPNPPNPLGYLLDPGGGPLAGQVWTPLVDETAFAATVPPALFLIGVAKDAGPLEVPFGADFFLISLLPPNPIATIGPVVGGGGATPVPIPIPAQCTLIGVSLATQAGLVDGAGAIQLANAIDIVLGGGTPGLYSLAADYPVSLHRLDPATGATLGSVPINLPGFAVEWGTAMAKNPVTGELWAVLKITGGPSPAAGPRTHPRKSGKGRGAGASGPGPVTGRILVTVCPLTGDATFRYDLQDAFAGMAFDATGGLWLVTGDGAAVPHTLFYMDVTVGLMANMKTLGNGLDGEMLAYNAQDGLLYHGSGNFALYGSDNVLETIDPLNLFAPPVDIPLAGSVLNGDETNAISAYDAAAGGFWWASGCCSIVGGSTGVLSELFLATPTGAGAYVGPMDHFSKGLATIP